MSLDYRGVPIEECGEPLVELPPVLRRWQPHPYVALGAPYGDRSPFYLRVGVVERLLAARAKLLPLGLDLIVFDAWRPLAVQQFMVERTFIDLVRRAGHDPEQMGQAEKSAFLALVHQFWAIPSPDPATPPPHSTGAAVDLTLTDAAGAPLAMGGEIDEVSERSYPDHYASATDAEGRTFHRRRQLLGTAMAVAGFARHPREWWHYSAGDQLWAWLSGAPAACYGGTTD